MKLSKPYRIAGALLLFVGMAVSLLWKRGEQAPEASVSNPAALSAAADSQSAGSSPSARPAWLHRAVHQAEYINYVSSSVDTNRGSTRDLLKGLQAALWIKDYVLDRDPSAPLTFEAVVSSSKDVCAEPRYVVLNLATYSTFPETLGQHYERVSRSNKQVTAIENSVHELGLTLSSESDLRLDCWRLASIQSDLLKVFGPPADPTQDPGSPDELKAARQALGRIFYERFVTRHHIEPALANRLVDTLAVAKLSSLGPADFEVPAPIVR